MLLVDRRFLENVGELRDEAHCDSLVDEGSERGRNELEEEDRRVARVDKSRVLRHTR